MINHKLTVIVSGRLLLFFVAAACRANVDRNIRQRHTRLVDDTALYRTEAFVGLLNQPKLRGASRCQQEKKQQGPSPICLCARRPVEHSSKKWDSSRAHLKTNRIYCFLLRSITSEISIGSSPITVTSLETVTGI